MRNPGRLQITLEINERITGASTFRHRIAAILRVSGGFPSCPPGE
jgi:hypothetical protein